MEKITLYHQNGCGMCMTVEMQLKQKHIEFDSCKDIELMKQKGFQTTPVLEVIKDGVTTTLVGKDILSWIRSK